MRKAVAPDDTRISQLHRTWCSAEGAVAWFSRVNHKNVGLRYVVTAFVFFLAAGTLALLMRLQLAVPDNDLLDADTYNQMFTLHGTAMMFLFAIPMVEGLGALLVPLMIGTRDLSFPRLSAFSYFVFLIGGAVLWLSLLFDAAPDAGWFSYVPLSLKEFSPERRIDVYATVITFIEVAALAAAVELIVTILRQRAPGMTLARIPPFVWSILVMAFMIVFAMPGVVVASVMLALDRIFDTAFFDYTRGGDALLWQHQFWWFGHPEVYILFLPASGVISTIVPVFCRRPLFAYTAVIASLVATGVLSFGLWVHHMFTTGIPTHASGFFAAASAMIAIPSGVQVFAWLATLWGGRVEYRTPMLFALGFIVLFVLGGATGVMVAAVPFDTQVHDSYFVVAHFHYVLIGGVVFPLFAGLYYWWPKFSGRMTSERLGRWSFWLMFLGFNLAFFPMHFLGFLGMPRRVYTYLPGLGWDQLNLLSSIASFIFALGVLLSVIDLLYSLKCGAAAGDNPWSADTLEWLTTSPPESFNFAEIPAVESLHPLWASEPPCAAVDGMNPEEREILVTSSITAETLAVVILPGPSYWPLLLAITSACAFVGSIFDPWWFVGAFFAAFIAISGWLWPPKPWGTGTQT